MARPGSSFFATVPGASSRSDVSPCLRRVAFRLAKDRLGTRRRSVRRSVLLAAATERRAVQLRLSARRRTTRSPYFLTVSCATFVGAAATARRSRLPPPERPCAPRPARASRRSRPSTRRTARQPCHRLQEAHASNRSPPAGSPSRSLRLLDFLPRRRRAAARRFRTARRPRPVAR